MVCDGSELVGLTSFDPFSEGSIDLELFGNDLFELTLTQSEVLTLTQSEVQSGILIQKDDPEYHTSINSWQFSNKINLDEEMIGYLEIPVDLHKNRTYTWVMKDSYGDGFNNSKLSMKTEDGDVLKTFEMKNNYPPLIQIIQNNVVVKRYNYLGIVRFMPISPTDIWWIEEITPDERLEESPSNPDNNYVYPGGIYAAS